MLCLLPCCPESPRFLMLVTMDEDEAEKGQKAKYTFDQNFTVVKC